MTDHDDDTRLTWDSPTFAAKLGRSLRTLHRWRAEGILPEPLPRLHPNSPYEWDVQVAKRWMRGRGLKVG